MKAGVHLHEVVFALLHDMNVNKCIKITDRLCDLVVRVLDYRCRGPRFDSRALPKKSNGSETGSTQPREYN
jgi:hypothetical protein